MVFACQKDSFLTEFTSKVKSCVPSKANIVRNGKKETIDGFEVILEDTILFPEGGGQPWDLGLISGENVIQVTRKGADAVHFLKKPLQEGEVVNQKLNWDRRLDHMQQHSGQHLITAVADAEFKIATLSWWLGEELSYIELDTPQLTAEQCICLESLVNQYIREARPVTVKEYEANDPQLKEARTRGLPDDHVGLVRVVTIEGLENNICCGTHVSNLSQLQVIKLLGTEKGKKGKTKLNFLAGSRVLKKLEELLSREAALTSLLQNNGSIHAELVEKLQESFKCANKNLQALLREVAAAEAESLTAADPQPQYFILHKREADMDFINTFLRNYKNEDVLLLLVVGEDSTGQLVLQGKSDIVSKLGPRICEAFGGKGFGKGNKFQGKVTKINMQAATQLIKEALAELSKE